MESVKKRIRDFYVTLSGGNGNFICGDSKRRIRSHRINLHYWRPSLVTDNLGDYLSKLIIENLLKEKGLSLNQPVNKTLHLLGIGSILGFSPVNATVWGSGLLHVGYRSTVEKSTYDIRAVRGPETKRFLESCGHECPNVFGDPAILLPLLYHPQNIQKRNKYTIIPRMKTGIDSFKKIYGNVLDIETNQWEQFIDDLLSSELVIASSLHGIILAETYGIPAIFYKAPDYDHGGKFKYDDYYYSTGRHNYRVASSIEEAFDMEPEPLPQFDQMRNNLLAAFPYDLWEKHAIKR